MPPSQKRPQRLRANIFDIADGEQRRKAVIIEGPCPILTAFKTNSCLAAVTLRWRPEHFQWHPRLRPALRSGGRSL